MGGVRKRPVYKIVIADGRYPRDGKFIEKIGSYNPLLPKDKKERIKIEAERVKYWMSKGAQPTLRVSRLLGELQIMPMPKPGNNPQKAIPKKDRKKSAEETKEAPKTEGKKVTIYSPYYGMGADHNRGICFTADMEWLSIEGLKPDPKKITLQVKEHRGFEPFTLGRFNTVYIGGTIHELGHGLSLPHNLATIKESIYGTALMGAGNYTYRKEWRKQGKGSFLTHSSALRLLVHPLFSGTSDLSRVSPNLTYEKINVFEIDGVIRIQGKISSEIPTIAMIAYNDRENKGQRGYMVNNNYDATSWTSVLNQDNEFQINIEDLRDGNHQIRLLSIHANGATETKRLHYSIEDGKPNFTQAQKEIVNIIAN